MITRPRRLRASIGEVTQQPFVVGVVPVVGNGAVGGVAIDAHGVMAKAEERDVVALRDARRNALSGLAGDVTKRSELRKISLRRLDDLLAQHVSQNKPLSSEILYLAGLQRIEYVFAYPDSHDIVLAGPAEAWTVDDRGNVVGTNSGAAVLHLVDLIAALRTKDQMLAGKIISCSIDPTAAGLKQFARLTRSNQLSPSPELLRRMEQAVGPQTITLSGVAPESHFAQVLVAADWQMKRLGMGLVPSPVDGLTSYLELLNEGLVLRGEFLCLAGGSPTASSPWSATPTGSAGESRDQGFKCARRPDEWILMVGFRLKSRAIQRQKSGPTP